MINNNTPLDNVDSQTLINQIVSDYIRENKKRKRGRRWIKIIAAIIIVWIAYEFIVMHAEEAALRTNPHIGLIDLKGAIFDAQTASADNFIKGLDKAYESKGLKAIIVRIDSPGGSPVQADYIYNTIEHYRTKFSKIKIYAVCSDICASAAYYVAAAADEIYADPSSLVGSIGVIYNGFGFVDAMQKIGVTRRLQVAGRNKGFMDQFSRVSPDQEKILQTMLDTIHQQFIEKVKKGRGQRLHVDEDTFSGLFWTGVEAKARGLIDGFGSSGQVARDVIKIDEFVDYTYQPSVMEKVAKNFGTAMADQLPLAFGLKPGIQ